MFLMAPRDRLCAKAGRPHLVSAPETREQHDKDRNDSFGKSFQDFSSLEYFQSLKISILSIQQIVTAADSWLTDDLEPLKHSLSTGP